MATAFPQAVASFEPTDDGILLWTRLGEGLRSATWLLAADPDLTQVLQRGEVTTAADRDHTVVADISGLRPGTTYWYAFEADGERSPIGRTRTLPGPGAERVRLATVSCARFSVAPLGVYRAVADHEVDLVVHLGDYAYEDDGAKGARDHDPPHTAVSLDDYRRRLRQIRADPDAQALHLRHPMVTIWDDHDLADNAWRDGAKHHDPEVHGPWASRVAAAARARQEYLPARLPDPADPTATFRSVAIGDLAELLLLDTRFIGRDRQAGDDGSPDLDDPERSLLGPDQRAWLHERLADTSRPWALVASGVVVSDLELPWPRGLRWINALLPNGYAVLDGRVLHDDQWDGYPAERARLVDALRRRAEQGGRAVVLSGDVHSSWAFEGPYGTDGEAVAVEVTSPAVSSPAMGRAHPPFLWKLLDRQANQLAHVRFAELTERGYCTVEVDRLATTATWWAVRPYDRRPGATTVALASFRSARGHWPPTWRPVAPPSSPDPVPQDAPPVPGRPADLERVRRHRYARLSAQALAATAAVLAPLVGLGWAWRAGRADRRPTTRG